MIHQMCSITTNLLIFAHGTEDDFREIPRRRRSRWNSKEVLQLTDVETFENKFLRSLSKRRRWSTIDAVDRVPFLRCRSEAFSVERVRRHWSTAVVVCTSDRFLVLRVCLDHVWSDEIRRNLAVRRDAPLRHASDSLWITSSRFLLADAAHAVHKPMSRRDSWSHYRATVCVIVAEMVETRRRRRRTLRMRLELEPMN